MNHCLYCLTNTPNSICENCGSEEVDTLPDRIEYFKVKEGDIITANGLTFVAPKAGLVSVNTTFKIR